MGVVCRRMHPCAFSSEAPVPANRELSPLTKRAPRPQAGQEGHDDLPTLSAPSHFEKLTAWSPRTHGSVAWFSRLVVIVDSIETLFELNRNPAGLKLNPSSRRDSFARCMRRGAWRPGLTSAPRTRPDVVMLVLSKSHANARAVRNCCDNSRGSPGVAARLAREDAYCSRAPLDLHRRPWASLI